MNMNKAVAVTGGIVALLAIVPIDLFAWWRLDYSTESNTWTNWIDALNQFHSKLTYSSPYVATDLNYLYLSAGMLAAGGAVLMLIGGLSVKKFFTVVGAIVTIAGPIVFLVAHYDNSGISVFLGGTGDNLFFGTYSNATLSWTWYLSAGFFLPIGGGILGFLSLKSK